MLFVHGLGSRVWLRQWPSLEVPHSSSSDFFFFLCVNLVLWLNTMFYTLDSFCFRPFFLVLTVSVRVGKCWNGDGVKRID